MGQTLSVNARAWHNKRYTKDEIKKIQIALNKHALGKLIEEDGIFGSETLNAIKEFLNLHKEELKVDGLVGDLTLSALGITNIADSSLKATRPGEDLSRGSSKKPNGMSDADWEYLKNYYTNPDMISYLMNPTNANVDPLYMGHYLNALLFVSPEIASKLRAVNNEGDEYDQEVAANRDKSAKRKIGIQQFKHAIASGHLKTDKDFDLWMNDHHLSKEEMLELINDPSTTQAMLRAGVIADNGRLMSHSAQSKEYARGVGNALHMFGMGILNTLSAPTEGLFGTVKDLKEDGISSLKPSTWLYNRLNNTLISGYTGGAPTYFTDVVGSTGNEFVDYGLDMMVNPQFFFKSGSHGGFRGVTGKSKPTYWRTGHKAGLVKTPARTTYQGYLEANPFNNNVGMLTQETVTTPAQYWKSDVTAGLLRSPGRLKFGYMSGFDGYNIPVVHGGRLISPERSVVLQEVPDYNRGITYAPWLGYNTVSTRKKGGNLTLKKKNRVI